MTLGDVIAIAVGALVALGFVAFELRRTKRNAAKPTAPTPSDTRKEWTLETALEAFTPGTVFPSARGTSISIEVKRVADLHLETGHIVACDPLVFPDTPAFARTVLPGDYPIDVSIARIASDHIRIAAVRVTFKPGTPARLELAVLPGQDLAGLGDGDFYGYGVDAGLGCFMDEATAALLRKQFDSLPPEANYYDDVLAKQLEPNREWVDHRPDPARPENVVIVHSGWGDGVYPTYWILDANDEPLALVTDFTVVP